MASQTENEKAMQDALAKLGRSILGTLEKKDAEIAQLRTALLQYGEHKECQLQVITTGEPTVCTCGLEAILSSSSECCLNDPGGGLVCTLRRNHSGPHEAWGTRKNLLGSWAVEKASDNPI